MPSSSSRPDVLILGAGVFGLASAWNLARHGLAVTVLDRAPVGTEASGMALGRLDPLFKGSGPAAASEQSLPDGQLTKPQAQAALARLSFDLHGALAGELREESGIDVQVDRQPTLQMFYTEAEREFGVENAAKWREDGFPTEILDPGGIREIDSRFSPPEFGGALVEGPYFIDSLRFAQALAACARNAGAQIETAHVTSIDAEPSTRVHTDQGHYDAGTVVLAMGAWTGEAVKKLGGHVPVYPSKGEILRLRPPEGGGFTTHLLGPCSLVLKKDGLVWAAATSEDAGFDRAPTSRARDTLMAGARLMMPEAAAGLPVKHTVCFRPETPDGMPVVGKLDGPGTIYVASGGGGSGIMQCLFVGKQVAGMVLDGAVSPEFDAISSRRFS